MTESLNALLQMGSPEILLSSSHLQRYVGGTQPCLIVAEIGQNHQGDLNIAKQLIQVAKVSYLIQTLVFLSLKKHLNVKVLRIFCHNMCID